MHHVDTAKYSGNGRSVPHINGSVLIRKISSVTAVINFIPSVLSGWLFGRDKSKRMDFKPSGAKNCQLHNSSYCRLRYKRDKRKAAATSKKPTAESLMNFC